MPSILPIEDLQTRLSQLEGWSLEGNEIVRTFSFATYLKGIDFVNAVAREAEVMNHHPDLLVTWRKVTVRLTTHSAEGVTELDFKLAKFCSET
jgi:4a-hydroxytetrahydrobiopterin dehydratase